MLSFLYILQKKPMLGFIGTISPNIVSELVDNMHPFATISTWIVGGVIGVLTTGVKWLEYKKLRKHLRSRQSR